MAQAFVSMVKEAERQELRETALAGLHLIASERKNYPETEFFAGILESWPLDTSIEEYLKLVDDIHQNGWPEESWEFEKKVLLFFWDAHQLHYDNLVFENMAAVLNWFRTQNTVFKFPPEFSDYQKMAAKCQYILKNCGADIELQCDIIEAAEDAVNRVTEGDVLEVLYGPATAVPCPAPEEEESDHQAPMACDTAEEAEAEDESGGSGGEEVEGEESGREVPRAPAAGAVIAATDLNHPDFLRLRTVLAKRIWIRNNMPNEWRRKYPNVLPHIPADHFSLHSRSERAVQLIPTRNAPNRCHVIKKKRLSCSTTGLRISGNVEVNNFKANGLCKREECRDCSFVWSKYNENLNSILGSANDRCHN